MKPFRQNYTLYVYRVYKIHIAVKCVMHEIFLIGGLFLLSNITCL